MVRIIEGKEYNFRMTRRSIRMAEKNGLNLDETAPMTLLYALWYAALYSEQPMSITKSDELLDKYLDNEACEETVSELLESLAEDYSEVFK